MILRSQSQQQCPPQRSGREVSRTRAFNRSAAASSRVASGRDARSSKPSSGRPGAPPPAAARHHRVGCVARDVLSLRKDPQRALQTVRRIGPLQPYGNRDVVVPFQRQLVDEPKVGLFPGRRNASGSRAVTGAGE